MNNDNNPGDHNECFNINKHINNMAKIKNKLIMIAQWGFVIGMLYFIYHVLRIIIILIRWLT